MSVPIFDAHLDLAWNALGWERDLTQPVERIREGERGMSDHRSRGSGTVSLPAMRDGEVRWCMGTLLARVKGDAPLPDGAPARRLDYPTAEAARDAARAQLDYYGELQSKGEISLVRDRLGLGVSGGGALRSAPACGVVVAMEGDDPIVSANDVAEWFERGLRVIGVAHYGQGRYAMGTGGEGPLTSLGVELLRGMERVGMVLDLTHCAEPGWFEALDRFGGRVLASHNNCRSLVPGDRQFSDEQIRRLIERDAVIGVAFDGWMLYRGGWVRGQTSREVVSLDDVADHIDHICQVAGDCRHVGIGSDLDGGFGSEQTPREIDTISDVQKLAPVLSARGYDDEEIEAIFHRNWLEFFSRSLPLARGGLE